MTRSHSYDAAATVDMAPTTDLFGGGAAGATKYPFAVALVNTSEAGFASATPSFCGGSLISPR